VLLQSKDMCAEPARSNEYEETWQHSVVLTGLEPSTIYDYSVSHDPTQNFFRSAPRVGSTDKFSFLMYGDMGVSSHKVAKAPGCGPSARHA
jgi:hypothetical protein